MESLIRETISFNIISDWMKESLIPHQNQGFANYFLHLSTRYFGSFFSPEGGIRIARFRPDGGEVRIARAQTESNLVKP